ncbi:hypothetical protein [Pengzhenrongella phosphoraccumulans]|uniref:hypothetical protein n=1 Tax=Pengzhenrongella phosphoraccumulans TaxID=3114394 RepID=UPI003890E82B
MFSTGSSPTNGGSRRKLRATLGPDAQIHYDHDWLDAEFVSMGSMGIITSLVYEATDQC